jgi:hypothetical protein
MAVIQRGEHFAKYVKKLIIRGQLGHFWPVGVVLLFPVDIPQFEKRIPVVKGIPQFFEVTLGVGGYGEHRCHGARNLPLVCNQTVKVIITCKYRLRIAQSDESCWVPKSVNSRALMSLTTSDQKRNSSHNEGRSNERPIW